MQPGQFGSFRLRLLERQATGAFPRPVRRDGRKRLPVGAGEDELAIGGPSGCEAMSAQPRSILACERDLSAARTRLRGEDRI